MNTPNHIPLREYDDFNTFLKTIPRNTKIIGIELDEMAENIYQFKHPQRSIYILGAEDTGIPKKYLEKCDYIIKLPFNKNSFNVAVTGSIVLYDRAMKYSTRKKS